MKCDWCGKYINKSDSLSTYFGYFCSRKCFSQAEKNGLKENYNPNEQDISQVLSDPNREWDISGGCTKIIIRVIIILALAVGIALILGK